MKLICIDRFIDSENDFNEIEHINYHLNETNDTN